MGDKQKSSKGLFSAFKSQRQTRSSPIETSTTVKQISTPKLDDNHEIKSQPESSDLSDIQARSQLQNKALSRSGTMSLKNSWVSRQSNSHYNNRNTASTKEVNEISLRQAIPSSIQTPRVSSFPSSTTNSATSAIVSSDSKAKRTSSIDGYSETDLKPHATSLADIQQHNKLVRPSREEEDDKKSQKSQKSQSKHQQSDELPSASERDGKTAKTKAGKRYSPNEISKPSGDQPYYEDLLERAPEIAQWYGYIAFQYHGLKGRYEQLRKVKKELEETKRNLESSKIEIETQKKRADNLESSLAHQSIDRNRTLQDDSVYVAAFENINGSLKSIAYKYRENWVSLPEWISSVKNVKTIPLRRALLAKWIAEDIFDVYLHPALDIETSVTLKKIDKSFGQRNPREVAIWRQNTVKNLIPEEVTGQQGSYGTLEALPAFARHRAAVLESFANRFSRFWDPKLLDPLTKRISSFPEDLILVVDEILKLLASMSLETRNIIVKYYNPGEVFNPEYMSVDDETDPPVNGSKVSLCGFVSVEKIKDNARFVIFRPQVWVL
ncbi:hypothetical protein V1514DRAFT_324641 [Lipomyces japonicus]|uniref:uncharacterized protein n=1 Tax=Lipomyces japonicus TaxID=56871 RepID=UPI0034CEAC90